MKLLRILTSILALIVATAHGEDRTFTKATQALVDAGTDDSHGVTPKTLKNATLIAPTIFISTSGSSTNGGTSNAPMATLQQAINRLTNSAAGGIILIRGGNYTNQTGDLGRLKGQVMIAAYPGETVSFWLGTNVSTWTQHSGSIYSNTAPADATTLAGLDFGFTASGARYAFERGTPYGLSPFESERWGYLVGNTTNRLSNYPLIYTNAISGAPNGYWTVSNSSVVYVKFSDGGAPGGRVVSWPSQSRILLTNANPALHLTLQSLRIYYGNEALDLGGAASLHLNGCYWEGCMFKGLAVESSVPYVEMNGCEGAANSGYAADFTFDTNAVNVIEENSCYWHDNAREGSSARGRSVRYVNGSFAAFNQYGFIQDGLSVGKFLGITSYSNHWAMQMGGSTNLGFFRTLSVLNSRFLRDAVGIQIDEGQNLLSVHNSLFDPTDVCIGFNNFFSASNAQTTKIEQSGNTFGNASFIAGCFLSGLPSNLVSYPWIPVSSYYGAPSFQVDSNGPGFISSTVTNNFIQAGNRVITFQGSSVGIGEQGVNSMLAGDNNFRAGGTNNYFTGSVSKSAILGGNNARIVTSGGFNLLGPADGLQIAGASHATVLNGVNATVSGDYSTALMNYGGNVSGKGCLVSGGIGTVSHDGALILTDWKRLTLSGPVSSTETNQFVACFDGGYFMGASSNRPATPPNPGIIFYPSNNGTHVTLWVGVSTNSGGGYTFIKVAGP